MPYPPADATIKAGKAAFGAKKRALLLAEKGEDRHEKNIFMRRDEHSADGRVRVDSLRGADDSARSDAAGHSHTV